MSASQFRRCQSRSLKIVPSLWCLVLCFHHHVVHFCLKLTRSEVFLNCDVFLSSSFCLNFKFPFCLSVGFHSAIDQSQLMLISQSFYYTRACCLFCIVQHTVWSLSLFSWQSAVSDKASRRHYIGRNKLINDQLLGLFQSGDCCFYD